MSLATAGVPTMDLMYGSTVNPVQQPDGHQDWYARYENGPRRSLADALRRWCDKADAVDRDMLGRTTGAVLDAGCGPGRLVIELARQGREALGLDTSRVAVRLAQSSGATVVRGSIFDPVPGEGRWDTVLLADGNIGIDGDPVALLARCRELIAPDGRVIAELDPPGTGVRTNRIRLERGSQRGSWFDWAHVGCDAIEGPAADAGLRVADSWTMAGRSFAALAPQHGIPGGGVRRAFVAS